MSRKDSINATILYHVFPLIHTACRLTLDTELNRGGWVASCITYSNLTLAFTRGGGKFP